MGKEERINSLATTILKIILVAWFIVLSWFTFFYSYDSLANITEGVELHDPPKPPEEIEEFDEATVNLYKLKVALYKMSIDAYNTYAKAVPKTNRYDIYRLVVKDTLSAYLIKFLAALLAYAFAKGVATMMVNRALIKQGKDALPIRLFD